MRYLIRSKDWVISKYRLVDISDVRHVRNHETGEVLDDAFSLELSYISNDRKLVTIPFAAISYDDKEYGRKLHEDLTAGIKNLIIHDADPWISPSSPPAGVDQRYIELATIKARLAELETLL